jgi:hypothetical protein
MPFCLLVATICVLTSHPPDEAPAARAWWQQLDAAIVALGEETPAIAATADEASARLAAGASLGVRGNRALATAFAQDPGGLQWCNGAPGGDGDVVILAFVPPTHATERRQWLQQRRREAMQLTEAGGFVIGIGAGGEASDVCDAWLTLPDDPHLQRTLLPVVAWAWQAELFAAFTRRGLVPVVRRSVHDDTRQSFARRYGLLQRFHDDRWLDPIAPGELAASYLSELRLVLRDVGTASWPGVAEAGNRARQALRRGGSIWVLATGHAAAALQPPLRSLDEAPRVLGVSDLVLAIGSYEPPGTSDWDDPDHLRTAGLGVAWITNTHFASAGDVRLGSPAESDADVIIDLWAPLADAVVRIPHHDAPLGPVSAVVAVAVMEAVRVEATRDGVGQRPR